MKIRHGFVSNSSSSSFIIAVKDENVPTKINIEADLKDLDTEIFNTFEEYIEHFAEEWGQSVDEFIKENKEEETFMQVKRLFKEGKIIIKGNVSSDDCENPISMYLYTEENIRDVMPKDAKFEVIQDTNEY